MRNDPPLGKPGLALAVILLSSLGLAQPNPANKAAADSLFDEARRLTKEGNYLEACPKFEESQRLDPGVGTMLFLGECYEKTGRTASAWTTFREAAAMAKNAGRSDREKTARERATALEKQLVKLQVSVPPDSEVPGLSIQRNGEPLSRGLWGLAIAVDPGSQKIEASAPNRIPWSSRLDATTGIVTVTIPLLPPATPAEVSAATPVVSAPPPPSAQPTAQPLPPPLRLTPSAGLGTQRTVALVAGGVGVLGLAAGSVFGLRSFSKWHDSRDPSVCNSDNKCTEAGKNLIGDARSAATLSTAFMLIGAAGLAGGTVLWFTAPTESRQAGLALVPGGGIFHGTW